MTLVLGCFFLCSVSRAQSIVDDTSALEEISTEFELADGPAWDGSGMYVPDVKARRLYRYQPKQQKMLVVLPDANRISACFFNHGKLYLSDNAESRISVLQQQHKQPLAEHPPQAKPPYRPNDLVVDKMGGVYYTLTSRNEVAYVAADGDQRTAVKQINSPNGIILSPDGNTLYVSAYRPKQVWAYEVSAPGVVGAGRLFATMDDGEAPGADGMTIDRAGNVYCAGASDVWIWSPGGALLDRIRTPTRPINCAYGDSDMRSLYITCFGGLYRQRMKSYGRAPHPPSLAGNQPQQAQRPSTTIPAAIASHLDVVYAQVGDRKLLVDIFYPRKATQPLPTIVVVHGGGWLKGDKSKFRAMAVALAQRGYTTAAIEYRLGYEAKFPAAIQDCNASVRFLRAHAEQYHVDRQRIAAVGGSAGGHLVGLLATAADNPRLQGSGGHSQESSVLQAAITLAGPWQIAAGPVADRSRTHLRESNSNNWLGKTIDEDPELYELADAYLQIDERTPPTLFMTGEHDNPLRNEPARQKLKEAGVFTELKVYDDGKHGCWNQSRWFTDMVADMDAFLRHHLK